MMAEEKKPNFAEVLHTLAESARARKQTVDPKATAEEFKAAMDKGPGPLHVIPENAHLVETPIQNELRLPKSQIIGDQAITWAWSFTGGTVLAMLIVKPYGDAQPGDFLVQLSFDDDEVVRGDSGQYWTFNAEAVQELAETLLAARYWEYSWKEHAADYLLKWLMPEPVLGEQDSEPCPDEDMFDAH